MIPLYTHRGGFPSPAVVFERRIYVPTGNGLYNREVTDKRNANLHKAYTINPKELPYTSYRNVFLATSAYDRMLECTVAGTASQVYDIVGFLHLNGKTEKFIIPSVYHVDFRAHYLTVYYEIEGAPRFLHFCAGLVVRIDDKTALKHVTWGCTIFYIRDVVVSDLSEHRVQPEAFEALMMSVAQHTAPVLCDFAETYRRKVGTAARKNALFVNVLAMINTINEAQDAREFDLATRALEIFVGSPLFLVTVQRYGAKEVELFVDHFFIKLPDLAHGFLNGARNRTRGRARKSAPS